MEKNYHYHISNDYNNNIVHSVAGLFYGLPIPEKCLFWDLLNKCKGDWIKFYYEKCRSYPDNINILSLENYVDCYVMISYPSCIINDRVKEIDLEMMQSLYKERKDRWDSKLNLFCKELSIDFSEPKWILMGYEAR